MNEYKEGFFPIQQLWREHDHAVDDDHYVVWAHDFHNYNNAYAMTR